MKGSLVIVVLILIIASVAIILINDGDSDEVNSDLIENRSSDLVGQQDLDSDPAEDKCEKGKVFGYPPVNLDKTLVVVPLGLMSGGHVTPIDHQYFQNFGNKEANIEVYSPGKGVIEGIQFMSGIHSDKGKIIEWEDYRLTIKHECKISSIYIHIDKLSQKIMDEAPKTPGQVSVSIPVEAGEVIGWYNNNVDFNLVDEGIVLSGLIVPGHYEREPWKIHVPNTLEYFEEEIVGKIIEKSLRNEEPFAGKFDWDVDGKLQGNWFEVETNFYAGLGGSDYSSTHLSISPDYLDHNHIIVSMGDYDGRAAQFGVKSNSPNPAEVSVESGLIKYELVDYNYRTASGEVWEREKFAKIKEAFNEESVEGVVLIQMIEDRELKFEVFPGKTAGEVNGFSEDAKKYER